MCPLTLSADLNIGPVDFSNSVSQKRSICKGYLNIFLFYVPRLTIFEEAGLYEFGSDCIRRENGQNVFFGSLAFLNIAIVKYV
jgi:hypothetical protein